MSHPDRSSRQEIIQRDMLDLHKLGYAQQLYREMGGFSNFAISFSIISILTGAIVLFDYGLKFAGPIINTWGWPLVTLFVLCIAASMAELASLYPTAGGLYFWAFRLGGYRWAWVTAWLNLLGLVAALAGIDYGAAKYVIGAINRIAATDIPDGTGTLLAAMIVLMIPQVLINIFGIRLTARLIDLSVYWHIGGVLAIVLLLLIYHRHARPLSFLFEGVVTVNPHDVAGAFSAGRFTFDSFMMKLPGMTELYAHGGLALAFVLGLLQAQWTYTGYDASAHVAEETVMARLNSAWGIFLSVAVSALVGYVMLIILTLCIPDIAATVHPTNSPAVLYILYENLPLWAGHAVAILIGGAMWLCGLSMVTSISRMTFAFARDAGMPGYSWLRRIHPTLRTPVWAIVLTALAAVLLTLWAVLYSAVVALSTTALYLSYGIPIYLNLRNKMRRQGEYTTARNSPWSLGRCGPPINAVALAWIAFITVLFSIPPNELAGWSVILLGTLLVVYWLADARHRFTGPTPVDEAELRRLEVARPHARS